MSTSAKHIIPQDFEQLYIQLRQKEGRIYSDEEVSLLPEVGSQHPYAQEWRLRKQSFEKLAAHLERKERPLVILEIGCGNGWLAHRLTGIPGTRVIGTDINFTEVQQAARVFQETTNLHFIYGEAGPDLFEEMQFDVVVFAASIQYFPSITETIHTALRLLKPNGEIHIIDSHFYSLADISAARQRSLLYYQAAGMPEMANYYFHHSLEDLDRHRASILYDPNSLFNRFLRNKHPFHWICIPASTR
ncbi:MAG: class I SAM-dependent methyltransferase [Chitinophagaceae bacterium]|nr:class I SAM-dependent methyltransferase [Chitinophagaceae bacterium]